jgi:hypothetical protein
VLICLASLHGRVATVEAADVVTAVMVVANLAYLGMWWWIVITRPEAVIGVKDAWVRWLHALAAGTSAHLAVVYLFTGWWVGFGAYLVSFATYGLIAEHAFWLARVRQRVRSGPP